MTLAPAQLRPGLAVMAALQLGTAALAQEPPRRGWLHVVWDAVPDAQDPDARRFFLVDGRGRALQLHPDPGRRGARDQMLTWDRRLVEIVGQSPQLVGGVRAAEVELAAAPAPFITVLCRFADNPATPFTRGEVERVVGPLYPGVAQFYGELSRDPNVMSGNRVTDWYTLPEPRSAYVSETSTNFGKLVEDCSAAADPDVAFPDYFGINFQLNGPLSTRATPPYDTLSFGGSWTLTRDGQTRQYGATWLSGAHFKNYVVVTHEMGHALGWPHSSGRYGSEYDSRWDVMSVGYLRYEQAYGWLTIHTITHHKRAVGWITGAERWVPAMGAAETATIWRTALPPATAYLMAEIPVTPTTSLTVEARRPAGHDQPLPGEAIVLHEIEGRRAYVVDPDNNGNPNDEGAMWVPGETYTDSINGIGVSVLEASTTGGFGVSILRGWPLRVTVTGAGAVTSDAGGLNCTLDCSHIFVTRGVAVNLMATPAADILFAGWSGACTGSAACGLAMNGPRTVTATFAAGPVTIVSAAIRPAGVMGAAYRDTLRASGGAGAPGWSVIAGALPPGLSLASATGVISGIPEAAGPFEFTAEARTLSLAAAAGFTIDVGKPLLAAQGLLDHFLGGPTALTADQLRFLDLLGNRNGRLDVGDVLAWLRDTGAVP